MGKFESALEDCEMAILMNPNFIKAYYRKALALYEMTHKAGTDQLAINTLKEGLAVAKQQADQTEMCEVLERML